MTEIARPRIRKLEVGGFRGLSKLILDLYRAPDIVLIEGPNGSGKSSLLEAIALALTGESVHPWSSLCHIGIEELSVKAWHGTDEKPDFEVTGTGSSGPKVKRAPEGVTTPRDVQLRLSAWFQDYDRLPFDEDERDQLPTENGKTRTKLSLAQHLQGLPDEALRAREVLRQLITKSANARAKLRENLDTYTDAARSERVTRVTTDLEPLWALAMACGLDPESWKQEVAASRSNLQSWLDAMESTIRDQLARLRQQRPGLSETQHVERHALETRREVLERQLVVSEAAAETSRAALRWANADADAGVQSTLLTHIFEVLRDHRGRFVEGPPGGAGASSALGDVIEEFRLVRPEKVLACLATMESWERGHRAAITRQDTLERELAEVVAQIDNMGSPDEEISRWLDLRAELRRLAAPDDAREPGPLRPAWKALHDWLDQHGRREAWSVELATREEVEQELSVPLAKLDEKLQVDDQVRADIDTAVSQISWRFTLPSTQIAVEGEGEESNNLKYRTSIDGDRGLDHYSTGQRGQVGLAFTVGASLLARQVGAVGGITHGVLIVDDPSTAYDLTNLVREALLWRQLAYTPDEPNRLQIFISTHHDELSSRLLDHLVPPMGCSMQVLRFEAPTHEISDSRSQTPRFRHYTVDPSEDLDAVRKNLSRSIQSQLCR